MYTAIAHPLQVRSLVHLSTITTGQCCDLKIETDSGERWWLCRFPPDRTDHRITIEKYNDRTSTWDTTHVFTDRGTQ
jgi:hypothetical protein